jgi:hypothetical protein
MRAASKFTYVFAPKIPPCIKYPTYPPIGTPIFFVPIGNSIMEMKCMLF